MFTDARLLPDRASIETDLAIIGAGPAGITLARTLVGSGKRVCLIESGGLEAHVHMSPGGLSTHRIAPPPPPHRREAEQSQQ